eukprot:532919-Hanusia_phi.AAC.1
MSQLQDNIESFQDSNNILFIATTVVSYIMQAQTLRTLPVSYSSRSRLLLRLMLLLSYSEGSLTFPRILL